MAEVTAVRDPGPCDPGRARAELTDAFRAELVEAFREAMSGVCTPVSVVTTMDGSRPHGTTVSAFASLSMDPPMVLVSLDRGSDLLGLLAPGRRFGLNVLGSGQAVIAKRFARKGHAKFEDVAWTLSSGAPRLRGAAGWVVCTVRQLIEGGDHMIALGVVEVADSLPAPPLTYHARTFGTHTTVDGEQ